MSDGTGGLPGLPGLPSFDFRIPEQVAATPKNIFDLIRQSQTETMSSALPYVQQQLAAQGPLLKPFLEQITQQGEGLAAAAQSDIAARGLRGSDIEAAAIAGAREKAAALKEQMIAKVAMQKAQYMAEAIMKARGFDIQANRQMYYALAQALGEQYALQKKIELTQQQLKAYKDAMKEQSQAGLWGDVLGAAAKIGAAYFLGGK